MGGLCGIHGKLNIETEFFQKILDSLESSPQELGVNSRKVWKSPLRWVIKWVWPSSWHSDSFVYVPFGSSLVNIIWGINRRDHRLMVCSVAWLDDPSCLCDVPPSWTIHVKKVPAEQTKRSYLTNRGVCCILFSNCPCSGHQQKGSDSAGVEICCNDRWFKISKLLCYLPLWNVLFIYFWHWVHQFRIVTVRLAWQVLIQQWTGNHFVEQ